MRVTRYDSGLLRSAEPAPGGGIRIPAALARVGIQVYKDASGREIREYRPPSEVFSADSLGSLRGAPVTIGHRGRVTPSNWNRLAVGFVASDASDSGDGWVTAGLQLTTDSAINAVAAKDLAEVSAGYDTEILEQPGRTDNGDEYDRIQTQIRFNHIALGPVGFARAGRQARLRLDGCEEMNQEESGPMIFRIDGKEHDISSEAGVAAAAAAVASLVKARDEASARADAATSRADAAEARADAAEAKAKAEALAAETNALAARVAARCPELKTDGLSAREIRLATVEALRGIKIPSEKSDGYIEAFCDAVLAETPKDAPAEQYQSRTDSAPNDAYAEHLKRSASYHK